VTSHHRGGPSPFRLVLRWEDGRTRVVTLPRGCKTLRGTKVHASRYAADVGVRGSLALEEGSDATGWRQVVVSQVRNSVAGPWN
jgi:hypothetical protein